MTVFQKFLILPVNPVQISNPVFRVNKRVITSGTESIESAFEQAVRICTGYAALKEQSRFLKDIIQNSSCHTVIFDGSGDLWYSSFSGENGGDITEMLRSEIGKTQSENSRKFFKTAGGTLYSVEARLIPYSDKQYAAFFLNGTRVPMASGKYGILFSSRKETENQLYNSFYNLSGAMSEVRDEVEKLTQSGFPVMISGEDGTGKEQVARSIYVQSPLKKNPLVTVDCTLINDKSWGYLTNHYHSPFNDNHNTIYFKNIDDLSEERRKQLLSLIVDLNLCERNRLIFSSICGRGEFLPRQCLDFVKILTCVTMRLPALREKPGEIPALASLYLGILNVNLARQIIGFEPDAVTLLQNYDWPYNHSQFKRCLNELAVRTTTPYISCHDVQDFLDKEAKIPYYGAVGTTASSPSFNLNRPLNEIEKDIIRTVLEESGGNQSSAAKRLGISRTTLWRYLK